jgi:hypothetical protein
MVETPKQQLKNRDIPIIFCTTISDSTEINILEYFCEECNVIFCNLYKIVQYLPLIAARVLDRQKL